MAKRIKSGLKRKEIAERNRMRNISVKSTVRTATKKAEVALVSKSESSDTDLKDAISKIDKAVSKGVLHINTAARKKSNLMKKFNSAVKA